MKPFIHSHRANNLTLLPWQFKASKAEVKCDVKSKTIVVEINNFRGVMVERKGRVNGRDDSAMGRNHSRRRTTSDDSHSKNGDRGYSRAHETNKQHFKAIKSFLTVVVEKMDGCTQLFSSCGSHDDVLHTPPSKEANVSSKLQAPQVITAVEDVNEFDFRGTFSNDGTFPVSDYELLDARCHTLDEECDHSSICLFPSLEVLGQYPVIRTQREFLGESFERSREEKDMS